MTGTFGLNVTHEAKIRSWLNAANESRCDFPIQNLPYAVFRRAGSLEPFRGGVAIGDQIIDMAAVAALQLFDSQTEVGVRAAAQSSLNALMQLGPEVWTLLRHALFGAMRQGSKLEAAFENCLVPRSEVEYSLPAQIGDYTDFFTSIYHATAIGRLFRPDNPLLPNYRWIPIGYHGRSSSIIISGQGFARPQGQRAPVGSGNPTVGASRRLDYELELGIFIGGGNTLGEPIPVAQAEKHVFGLCLLNDWSARDLQSWEYQPLGPFLAKNFATSISPWIVTLEALAPFRVPFTRAAEDPQPLPYLDDPENRAGAAIDVRLETRLQTQQMRARGEAPQQLSHTSFRHSYWTIAQLVAHHTVNGCNLRPGDLFGSGTQSGPTDAEAGSLIELTKGGSQSIRVGLDEQRTFLEDGDTVIFRGWCERPGFASIGLGQLEGQVLPALTK
jgi:fumarylacetoacetase